MNQRRAGRRRHRLRTRLLPLDDARAGQGQAEAAPARGMARWLNGVLQGVQDLQTGKVPPRKLVVRRVRVFPYFISF